MITIIKRLFDKIPMKYAGLPSTIAISSFTVFLTVWSNSTLYLVTPLWFAPVFIVRNPRSDRLARDWFRSLKPLFKVKPIVENLRERSEAAGVVIFFLALGYLTIRFFSGDNRPDDWLPLLFYGLAGVVIALVIAGLSSFGLLAVLLALQVITMMCVSLGIRVLSTAYTLIRHFPYTVSRLYQNYYRIVFSDNLASQLEIAPRYSAKAYLSEVQDVVEKVLKSQVESIMDSRAKAVVGILLLIYYFCALAVAFVPTVVTRLCVKASFLPLCFIFVQQPQHLKSQEKGVALYEKIWKDRGPVLIATLLMFMLGATYAVHFLTFHVIKPLDKSLFSHVSGLVNFLNENYVWLGVTLTCSCTIIIFLLVLLFRHSAVIRGHEVYFDFVIRALSIFRMSCTAFTAYSVLTNENVTQALFAFLGLTFVPELSQS